MAPRNAAAAAPEPHVLHMPSQHVAIVRTVGDPNEVGPSAMRALYGSVYTLKFDRKKHGGGDFKVGALRARWEGGWLDETGALIGAKEQWRGEWALPIPEDVDVLPQKGGAFTVTPATWTYGEVAEVLHVGPYSQEPPTVQRLHRFIEEQGYEIAGQHEEEYLTRPDARVQKTLIRYPVRKKEVLSPGMVAGRALVLAGVLLFGRG